MDRQQQRSLVFVPSPTGEIWVEKWSNKYSRPFWKNPKTKEKSWHHPDKKRQQKHNGNNESPSSGLKSTSSSPQQISHTRNHHENGQETRQQQSPERRHDHHGFQQGHQQFSPPSQSLPPPPTTTDSKTTTPSHPILKSQPARTPSVWEHFRSRDNSIFWWNRETDEIWNPNGPPGMKENSSNHNGNSSGGGSSGGGGGSSNGHGHDGDGVVWEAFQSKQKHDRIFYRHAQTGHITWVDGGVKDASVKGTAMMAGTNTDDYVHGNVNGGINVNVPSSSSSSKLRQHDHHPQQQQQRQQKQQQQQQHRDDLAHPYHQSSPPTTYHVESYSDDEYDRHNDNDNYNDNQNHHNHTQNHNNNYHSHNNNNSLNNDGVDRFAADDKSNGLTTDRNNRETGVGLGLETIDVTRLGLGVGTGLGSGLGTGLETGMGSGFIDLLVAHSAPKIAALVW